MDDYNQLVSSHTTLCHAVTAGLQVYEIPGKKWAFTILGHSVSGLETPGEALRQALSFYNAQVAGAPDPKESFSYEKYLSEHDVVIEITGGVAEITKGDGPKVAVIDWDNIKEGDPTPWEKT